MPLGKATGAATAAAMLVVYRGPVVDEQVGCEEEKEDGFHARCYSPDLRVNAPAWVAAFAGEGSSGAKAVATPDTLRQHDQTQSTSSWVLNGKANMTFGERSRVRSR